MYVLGAALAVLSTLAGIIWIFARAPGNFTDHLIMTIGAIVGGFVMVVSLLAVAELLKLFIDVEHNTRTGAGAGSARTIVATDAAGGTLIATGGTTADAGAAMGAGADGVNRITALDEETAEAALIRGH